MRKIIYIVLAALLCAGAMAQDNGKILVDKKDLTAEQLTKIETAAKVEAIRQQVETAGKYSAAIREFGVGVAEATHEVTDGTIAFGRTDLGKATMVLIGFHVLGKEIFGYIVGFPVLVFLSYVFVVTWKHNCLPWTYVEEESATEVPAPAKWHWFSHRRTARRFHTDDEPVGEAFRYGIMGCFTVCLVVTIVMMIM